MGCRRRLSVVSSIFARLRICQLDAELRGLRNRRRAQLESKGLKGQ